METSPNQAFATSGNLPSATWNAPSSQYRSAHRQFDNLFNSSKIKEEVTLELILPNFLVSGHFYSIWLYCPKHQVEELQFPTVVHDISSHWEQCFLIKFQTRQATSELNFVILWAIVCKKNYISPSKATLIFLWWVVLISLIMNSQKNFQGFRRLNVRRRSCQWSFEIFTGSIMGSN